MAKRLLCVLLSVLMVVAMLPTGVFADSTIAVGDTITIDDTEYTVVATDNTGYPLDGSWTNMLEGDYTAKAYMGTSGALIYFEYTTESTPSWIQFGIQDTSYNSGTAYTDTSIFDSSNTTSTVAASEIYTTSYQQLYINGGSGVTINSVSLIIPTSAIDDLTYVYTVSSASNGGTTFITYIDYLLYNALMTDGATITVSFTASGTYSFAFAIQDSISWSGGSWWTVGASGTADGETSVTITDFSALTGSTYFVCNGSQLLINLSGSVDLSDITLTVTLPDSSGGEEEGDDGEEEDGVLATVTTANTTLFEFSISDYVDFSSGDTIRITAVMESDGYFNGGMGANTTSAGDWVEYTNDYDFNSGVGFVSSDGSALTVVFEYTTYGAAYGNIGVWYLGGTYVNLTSFTVEVVSASSTTSPSFYGRALTLDGEIGVTYYFSMDGVTNPGDYELVATIGGGTEQTYTLDSTVDIDDVTYYRYTVYVNPTELYSDIEATLTDGTTEVETTTYSVSTYCEKAIKNEDGTWSNEVALCEAVLNYGYYVETWLNKSSSIDISESDDDWTDPVGTWTVDLSSYSNSTNEEGVNGKTLALDGEGIFIRIYVSDGTANYAVSGQEVITGTDEDNGAYIEFKVAAKNMDKTFTIIKDGEEFSTYSVYSYIYSITSSKIDESNGITENLQNLCKAIYYYCVEAQSYNGWV